MSTARDATLFLYRSMMGLLAVAAAGLGVWCGVTASDASAAAACVGFGLAAAGFVWCVAETYLLGL